jgi:hypothetical protein
MGKRSPSSCSTGRSWTAGTGIELGIEPLATEIDTRDPLALVFTLNIHRRHLDTGQIAMLAAKVTERGNKGGRPAKNITVKSFNSFPSTRAAAAAAGVAHSYISEAVAVLEFDEECGGSLADQVKSGERPLWDAYRHVLRERERLSKKAKAQAEVEKLSEPLPVRAGSL